MIVSEAFSISFCIPEILFALFWEKVLFVLLLHIFQWTACECNAGAYTPRRHVRGKVSKQERLMVGKVIQQKETIIPRVVQGRWVHLVYFLLEKGVFRCGWSKQHISFLRADVVSSSNSAWNGSCHWASVQLIPVFLTNNWAYLDTICFCMNHEKFLELSIGKGQGF